MRARPAKRDGAPARQRNFVEPIVVPTMFVEVTVLPGVVPGVVRPATVEAVVSASSPWWLVADAGSKEAVDSCSPRRLRDRRFRCT